MDLYRKERNTFMKKALMLATVASMIDQFNMTNIKLLHRLGYEVEVAANFELGNTCTSNRISEFKRELTKVNVNYHQIDFSRKVTNIQANVAAYRQLKTLLKKNQYEFIHCHSPMGGVVGRIAGKKFEVPVIYTAHGFHFYKGASTLNWVLFYPIERYLSKWTDTLITINNEDYKIARNFHSRQVSYVPGVGVDIEKFSNPLVNRSKIREQLDIPKNAFVVLSIGELNENKNHEILIKAIAKLNNPDFYYVICGEGIFKSRLNELSRRLKLENQVKILGFRKDVAEILKASDVYGFPSFREGLSLSLLEAMSSELAIICSNIRGNRDIVMEGKGGMLFKPTDIEGFAAALDHLYNNELLRKQMGKYNREKVSNFSLFNVNKEMNKIYSGVPVRYVK